MLSESKVSAVSCSLGIQMQKKVVHLKSVHIIWIVNVIMQYLNNDLRELKVRILIRVTVLLRVAILQTTGSEEFDMRAHCHECTFLLQDIIRCNKSWVSNTFQS